MNKINILVVDDRPEGILAIQAVLTSPGYNIIPANSGQEALKCLLKDDFAVILMDVQMPLMNGFEAAEVIKTREKSKDIPIIFMSAINQDEQYVYKGYGVGAIDYLLKPFDPYILRSKVAIFVDLYKKNQLIKEQSKKIYESELKSYMQALDRLEVESLKRYQYLADIIPQIVFRVDANGAFDYFNKVWFEYTGKSQEKSSGNQWRDAIHTDDLINLLPIFEEAAKHGGSLETECRIRNRDGIYRWHLIRMEAETYGNSNVISTWIGTATDIEDRKRNEEAQKFLAEAGALLVSSLDFNLTLKRIADLAVTKIADWCAFDLLDETGEIFTVAVGHKEKSQMPVAKEIHQIVLDNLSDKIGVRKVLRTGRSEIYTEIDPLLMEEPSLEKHQIEVLKELNAGSSIVVPITVKGEVIGAMSFLASSVGTVYNRQMLEIVEELGRRAGLAYENTRLYKISQQAIEIRNDFLSIASHELNTPITSLKLQLQITKKTLEMGARGEFPLDRFNKSIDSSVRQVDRLINLVQILLDVSRIQSGKLAFNFERFNVNEVIDEIVERHREIVNQSHCHLNLEIENDIVACLDKTRFEQVVVNLLTNAIKYAPGEILLRVYVTDGHLKVEMRDHGQGIPEDKLATIFDRFARVTSHEGVSGLGLGLFIVKQIIEGHHGHIEVSSKVEDGSQFIVTLPMDAMKNYPGESVAPSLH